MAKISGGCLCGRVKYEIENAFERFFLCHCAQCRKITGSAYASNLFGKAASYRTVEGADFITLFDYPDRGFRKCFCRVCGSGLPHDSSTPGVKVVPAGSLNEEPVIEGVAHIFDAETPDWDLATKPAPKYDRFPD